MSVTRKNFEAIFDRGYLPDYLFCDAYIGDGIYALGENWGLIIECDPIPYAGNMASEALESLFTATRTSDDWYMSLMMYASPNIKNIVDEFVAHKSSGTTNIDDDVIRELFRQRGKFYLSHTKKSLFSMFDSRIRNFRLFLSVIIPMHSRDVDDEISNIKKAKNEIFGVLEPAGFTPRVCGPETYIEVMREILNVETPDFTYNPLKSISAQVVSPETRLKILDTGDIDINGSPHRVFSIRDYPREIALFQFGELLGSFKENMKQIPVPFCVTLNMRLPDRLKMKDKCTAKAAFTTYQFDGNPAGKYIPALHKSYQQHQVAMELYDKGKMQTPLQLSLWVRGDNQSHVDYLGTQIRNMWQTKSFNIVREQDDASFPTFLSMLPLNYNKYFEKHLRRTEPLFSSNAANLAPVTSDWKGKGRPFMKFVSRRGQLINFDPFESDGNYNVCVVAESGKGKSFLTNEMVIACLAEGGKVFLVDVGRSYEKLCEEIGGEFIEFDPDAKNIVINPFSSAKIDIDGNLHPSEYELLIPLVGQMLGINLYSSNSHEQQTEDAKLAASLIEQAIYVAFKKHQNDTCWHEVINELFNLENERAKKIAITLHPYSRGGRYGRYVNGKDTFSYEKDFVVLEMDTLEQMEDLKGMFLMMMIYRISQDIFLDFERPKMVILEEAWDLMRQQLSAAFIEKGFRRFRKHNASAVVVTQSILDFFSSPVTQAIWQNCEWKLMLGQRPEAVEQAKNEKKLAIHDYFFDQLLSVHTVKGKYSEVMIYGSSGIVIARHIVDRYTYYLYTTNATDKKLIKQIRSQQNCSLRDAISFIIHQEENAHIDEQIQQRETIRNLLKGINKREAIKYLSEDEEEGEYERT
ncbi:MAG: type IV secretion system protein TraC [Geovibrio sp.]|nr:type IV secretion system protein TraC [Geovibrio sp.]